MNNNATPVLKCTHVVHDYVQADKRLRVLNGINFNLYEGELVALMGQSGSGKSTFLQILGLLENPTEGKVVILGHGVERIDDKVRTRLRNRYIGFVYQFHHLLPEFSALENVMMPLRIADVKLSTAKDRAAYLLERLGLSERLTHRPSQLSGGEQQRVAIARALANSPKLLLADEPTGNLDPQIADNVCDLLLSMAKDEGVAAIIATHNPDIAARLSKTIHMNQGLLGETV